MTIRLMAEQDFVAFWPVFQQTIQARETYAFAPDMTLEEAKHLWCDLPSETWVWEENGHILGSYFIKPNAAGPGGHVCNCGYMVSPAARGKGIATQLCRHSLERAKTLGFLAMQFNAVVSTNTVAVALWQKMGFAIVGTVPKAYQHATKGLVDIHVMYQWLA